MNILFAVSEAVPLIKTGGLADAAGALPAALRKLGAEVAIMLPAYRDIPEPLRGRFVPVCQFAVKLGRRSPICRLLTAELDGVRYYLLDHEHYFKRAPVYGYDGEAERFVFFSLAVVESLAHLAKKPDIVHCHDWQTGLIPFLLRDRRAVHPSGRPPGPAVRTVFTIHNLHYKGLLSPDDLMEEIGTGPEWFTPDTMEFHGAGSLLKAGLLYADRLTTVSPTYAAEIVNGPFGEGLEGVLSKRRDELSGILNGIDTRKFDPRRDAALASPYGEPSGKRRNKLALQRQLGLRPDPDVPLIGIVARLAEQKGFDLLEEAMNGLMAEDVQLAVLGEGEERYADMLRTSAALWPDRAAVRIGFDEALASRIYGGADLFLMPSRFEPCGLSQLIAMRYMCVPIVRNTGGLHDTVQPYAESAGTGNGFRFDAYRAEDMLLAIRRALAVYRRPAAWATVAGNGGRGEYGWDSSARAYYNLYRKLALYGKESV